MKFDHLFLRSDPDRSWRERKEPRLRATGRALVPTVAPVAEQDEAILPPLRGTTVEVRRMSPRQMAEWAYELYLSGALTWEEYCIAGFPAELHPEYNRTIGALTGVSAQPDWPRDMVREWEERLAFARRHHTTVGADVRRTEKIVRLLYRHAGVEPARRA